MSERVITKNKKTAAGGVWTKAKGWLSHHPKIAWGTVAVVVVLLVLGGTFYGGYRYGISVQKNSDENLSPYERARKTAEERVSNRTSSLGTITKISDSSMTISSSSKKEVTVSLDKNTTVADAKGKSTTLSSLKVDQRVLVIAEKQTDGSLRAQRIRIQTQAK